MRIFGVDFWANMRSCWGAAMANSLPAKCAFDAGQYKEIFLPRYRRNPALFAKEILRITPGGWQEGFLKLLPEGMGSPRGAHIALASGHETGKTYISCVAMFWGLCVMPDCHIYCTSSTFDQLKTRLWVYMQQIVRNSPISGWFDVDSEKVVFKHLPGNTIKALAWSKDKPQSWAGDHCFSPWGVFDECSDIDKGIFDAWSGSASKKNAVTLLMGQPRLRSGTLYEAFHKEREFWTGLHISSVDSPFSSKPFIEEARIKYGEDSDYYRIRVLGRFPNADSSQLFPEAREKKLEDCPPANPAPPVVAGLDIAAGGADKTILFMRRGNTVIACEKFDTGEHVLLAEILYNTLLRYNCHTVAADTIGYGYGLANMLAAKKDLQVVGVNGGHNAINKREYHNKRAEAYGRLAKAWKDLRFQAGRIKSDDLNDLGRQLESIRINYDSDMRIAVLKKEDFKKEIGESPDLADALAYSFMCDSNSALSPEARKNRMQEIRRIQLNSNPYRR